MTSAQARLTGVVPASKIVTTEIPRYEEDFAARLLAIPDISSAVADALDQMDVGAAVGTGTVVPLSSNARCAGPAVTVCYTPSPLSVADNRQAGTATVFGDRDVYGLGRVGDVAVMDCAGQRSGAVMGALSARWAVKAGIAGVVVDGVVRDGATVVKTGLSVFSAARNPAAARYRYDLVELNGPVTIFGTVVYPGDYIVADGDGVCIVPFGDVPRVVAHCEAADLAEQRFVARIDAAPSLEDLVAGLGPGPAPA